MSQTSRRQGEVARKNRRVALVGVGIVAGMTALTAYSPTLYSMFCRVTGYGGTTQVAKAAPGSAAANHTVAVSFDASVQPDLPWRFRPVQRRVTVALGEEKLAFYEAKNMSDQPIVGQAVYNVAPDKAGLYFSKIQCFCFSEQTLEPGQDVQMPVSFFVDPAMLDDPDASDIRDITLSYTFYIDAAATKKLQQQRAQAKLDEMGAHAPSVTTAKSQGG
ncbi:cytochrome c oxidase assembly protein subunit 11 [Arboricoccus pini]|uniref:Cytochrome c oxidase assembly protein CtaG n=1 Tax=Arboricoccus pini TaxID=1963835 RepID=A0A212QZE2_9PROT|nr:cytochrome c oxidase assembly protein [Arboricoccus pini]SNB65118.1 cytochrome c oxidase assembly protein subunit 11 [Arboricoccus pini]